MEEGRDKRKLEVPMSQDLLMEHAGGEPTPWPGQDREASVL